MSGDSWTTTSGLIDEYEMTLDEVWFGKDPNYQDGKATIFIVRGEAEVDGEVVDDEKRNFYGLGDGWEPDDGGETATHGSGKTQFNKNSNFGKFINAVVGLGDEVIAELKSRGETYEADTWRGLRFAFERQEFEFVDRKTEKTTTYSVELPVEFLGTQDGGKKGTATKPKAKASAAATGGRRRSKASTEAPEDTADTADTADEPEAKPAGRRRRKASTNDALRQAIVEFAAEWEDHGDFMAAVLDAEEFEQADEVNDNEELLNDILDPDGAIWTESREIEVA